MSKTFPHLNERNSWLSPMRLQFFQQSVADGARGLYQDRGHRPVVTVLLVPHAHAQIPLQAAMGSYVVDRRQPHLRVALAVVSVRVCVSIDHTHLFYLYTLYTNVHGFHSP